MAGDASREQIKCVGAQLSAAAVYILAGAGRTYIADRAVNQAEHTGRLYAMDRNATHAEGAGSQLAAAAIDILAGRVA